MRRFFAVLFVFAATLGACASAKKADGPANVDVAAVPDAAAVPSTPMPAASPPSYTASAADAYNDAESQLAAHRYVEARAAFADVKKHFAYSRYATYAERRIADIDFARGEYAKAAAEYDEFARAHRSDEEARTSAMERAEVARCRDGRAGGGSTCPDLYDAGF